MRQDRDSNDKALAIGQGLNDAQKLFCEIFVRNRNATMAYMQSHPGCTYGTASVRGYETIRNAKCKAYIDYLRDIKAEAIRLCPDDIVERYMKIAFADMSDFVTWGFDGNDNQMAAMPSEMIDGGLVCEISKSVNGFRIKLEDRQKALDWLASWFGMNPMDKHKIDFDRRKQDLDEKLGEAKIDQIKAATTRITGAGNEKQANDQIQAIADLINNPQPERKLSDIFTKEADADDTLCAADDATD